LSPSCIAYVPLESRTGRFAFFSGGTPPNHKASASRQIPENDRKRLDHRCSVGIRPFGAGQFSLLNDVQWAREPLESEGLPSARRACAHAERSNSRSRALRLAPKALKANRPPAITELVRELIRFESGSAAGVRLGKTIVFFDHGDCRRATRRGGQRFGTFHGPSCFPGRLASRVIRTFGQKACITGSAIGLLRKIGDPDRALVSRHREAMIQAETRLPSCSLGALVHEIFGRRYPTRALRRRRICSGPNEWSRIRAVARASMGR